MRPFIKKNLKTALLVCVSITNVGLTFAQEKKDAPDTSKALSIIKNRQKNEFIEFDRGNKETAQSFLEKYPEVYGLNALTKAVLKHEEEDELGMVHSRYGLCHWGYEVEDSDYWFHTKKGELHSANGFLPEMSPDIALPPKIIDSVEALNLCKELETSLKEANKGKNKQYLLKLVWADNAKDTLIKPDKKYFLAWKITNNKNSIVAYVNAENARLGYWFRNEQACQAPVNFTSNYYGQRSISTVLENGAYSSRTYCFASCGGVYKDIRVGYFDDNFEISPITSPNNTWTTNEQKNIATALWAANNTYDYFCDKHKWNSYDGENSALKVQISNTNTGYWSSGIITVGSIGVGSYITQDIVAHEFTHGVYGKFSGGIPLCNTDDVGFQLSCQLNALNESLADMFGTAVEYFALPTSASFKYGEDAVTDGFRNLSNPKSKGYPNCFKTATYPNPTNWCSVNCGQNEKQYNNGAVLSFWFHLLCNGGNGRVDDNINFPTYTVSAIGMDNATKIIFRALRFYMPWAQPNSGYYNFKLATLEAAKDLYGNCANEVIQISNAWKAVGLEGTSYANNLTLCGDYGGQANSQFQYHHINGLVNLPANTCSPETLFVKSGSKLIITSTQGIVLKSGFRAEAGSMFKATTTSCSSSTNRFAYNHPQYEDNLTHQSNYLEGCFYPNPASDYVSLKLPELIDAKELNFSLYTAAGLLKAEEFAPVSIDNGVLDFETKTLADGLYFIQLKPNQGKTTFLKLTVQH